MSRRGWQLKGRLVQLGMPGLFLFFEQDEVVLTINIRPEGSSSTSIKAILPPSKEALDAARTNWTAYTPGNSGLSGEFVNDIAIDPEGQVWSVSDGGVDVFDGSEWIHHEVKGVDVWNSPIEVDGDGNILLATSTGVAKYDGRSWSSIGIDEGYGRAKKVFVDIPGEIWVSLEDHNGNGLGLLEGDNLTYFANEEIGFHGTHIVTSLVRDPRGEVWISTDSGGLFVFDEDKWRTEQIPDCPPYNTGCYDREMLIDQQGWLWINEPGKMRVFNGQEWGGI